MSRLARKTAILAKIETTYNTDPTPTGAANAVLISNPNYKFSAQNVLQHLLIKGEIGHNLPQFRILVLKLLQTAHLRREQSVILRNRHNARRFPRGF